MRPPIKGKYNKLTTGYTAYGPKTGDVENLINQLQVANLNTHDVFCEVFEDCSSDISTASVPVLIFPIPAGDGVSRRGFGVPIDAGHEAVEFKAGFSYRITGTRGGTTAPALGCDVNILYF